MVGCFERHRMVGAGVLLAAFSKPQFRVSKLTEY